MRSRGTDRPLRQVDAERLAAVAPRRRRPLAVNALRLAYVVGSRAGESPAEPGCDGTLTAFPTSFHRSDFRVPSCSAGSVQSASNPCSRSASRISGSTTPRPCASRIAGGEGIPIVEPPFKRRYRVDSPAEPPDPFRPVEAARDLVDRRIARPRPPRRRTALRADRESATRRARHACAAAEDRTTASRPFR